MTFVYGTNNSAKLEYMRRMLAGTGVEISGLGSGSIPVPEETGSIPLDNARIKALAYWEALRKPVFSCDSGLFIDGLEDRLQPGVHIRRVGGTSLDDNMMIAHYTRLAAENGGSCVARYRNAICLVVGDGNVIEHNGDDICREPFLLLSRPHSKRRPGFPLDSLSAELASGNYYFDLDEPCGASRAQGFREFFSTAARTYLI